MWTNETLTGLPQGVVLKSIQVDTLEESENGMLWMVMGGIYIRKWCGWSHQQTDLPVRSIMVKCLRIARLCFSYRKDGEVYKFAKTMISSMNVLNEIPAGFLLMTLHLQQLKIHVFTQLNI